MSSRVFVRRNNRGSLTSLAGIVFWSAGAALLPAQSVTFAGDPQHTGQYQVTPQPLNRVLWSTKVSLTNFVVAAHYGAPLITPANTVIVPVRTVSGFEVSAFEGGTGRLKYTLSTDYHLPSYGWLPAYQPVLATPSSGTRLYYPGAGGTVYYIEDLDSDTPTAPVQQCFYTDMGSYRSNAAAFNACVFINTALTAGTNGAVFFGFRVETNAAPAPLNTTNGGIARLAPDGTGAYVLANQAAGDPHIGRVPHNCAPALSADGTTLYVIARSYTNAPYNGSYYSYLLGLDSVGLSTKYSKFLQLPDGYSADVSDNSTASPVVGPDGDVYFGVLTGARGFLFHFSGDLSKQMAPGSFGWDNTPAIVPASMVPGYNGSSTYLLFSKYNNYAGGGDGINKLAILDPNATQIDPYYSIPTMREVLTATGPTPDPSYYGTAYPYAVREWCISAAAVVPNSQSVLMPNEDGHLYRWDLATDSLSEALALGPSVSEAYVPTAIGPDGTVYTINNDTLYACGGWSNLVVGLTSSMPDLRPGVAGEPVTFTAIVSNTASVGATPTGTVTFNDLTYMGLAATNTTLAAGVPLSNGVASVTTSALAAGSNFLGNHFISVSYSGDLNYPTGSLSLVQKVHASASATTLTSSVTAGTGKLLLTAQVLPLAAITNVPSGTLAFLDGTNVVAQLPLNKSGIASTNLSFASGTHAYNASYSSDTIFASSSGRVATEPVTIKGALNSTNGTMVLSFTNVSGAPFEVLSTTNVSVPVTNWSVLGPATEISPGQYEFADPLRSSDPFEFYKVRSP